MHRLHALHEDLPLGRHLDGAASGAGELLTEPGPSRGHAWLLFLALVPLYLTWTFNHSLWNPESRDAGIAAEMYRSGKFAVPALNGETVLDQPPLHAWASAAAFKIGSGVRASASRFPSVVFGLLGILFTFLIGRRCFGERTAVFAAAILATTGQYFRMSHLAMPDIALTAAVTGAVYFHLRGSRLGFAAFTAVAFFANGFFGAALPVLAAGLDLAGQKRWKDLALTALFTAGAFVVFVLPWFSSLNNRGEGLLGEFLEGQAHRLVSVRGAGERGVSTALWLPVEFLPWTVFVLGLIGGLIRERRIHAQHPGRRFAMTWFVAFFAVGVLWPGKRGAPLLPVFPPLALLTAAWFDDMLGRDLPVWEAKLAFGLASGISIFVAGAVVVGAFQEPPNVPRLLLTAGPLLAGAVAIVRLLRTAQAKRAVYAMFGLVALSFALSSVQFEQSQEQQRSVVPFTRAVKDNLKGRDLAGFDLTDMECGALTFYLGKPFRHLESARDLEKALSEPSSERLLLMLSRNKLWKAAPLFRGRARAIYRFRFPHMTRSSYLLYAFDGEPAPR